MSAAHEQCPGQVVTDFRGEPVQEIPGNARLLVDCQPVAEAEFGIVLEQRVGPRRTAPVALAVQGVAGGLPP